MKIVFYASEIGGKNITNQCAVGESKRCELFHAFSLQLNPYSSHSRTKDNTSRFAPWPVCRLRVNYSAEWMEALSESLSKALYLSLAWDKFRLSPMDPVCWILIKICVVWPPTTRGHPITLDPHCREETRHQSAEESLKSLGRGCWDALTASALYSYQLLLKPPKGKENSIVYPFSFSI